MTSTNTALDPSRGPRTPWKTDLTAVWASPLCALIAWTVVGPLAGVDLLVRTDGTVLEVGPVHVVAAAVISAAAAVGLMRLLERGTDRALRWWLAAAALTFVVSLAGPAAAVSREAVTALVSLHAVVAAVIVASVWKSRS